MLCLVKEVLMKPRFSDETIFKEILHDSASRLIGRKTKHYSQVRDAINGILMSKKCIKRNLLNGNYNQLMKILDYPITDDKMNLAVDEIYEYTQRLIPKFEYDIERVCKNIQLINDSKTPRYIGKNEFLKKAAKIYRYVNHNEYLTLGRFGKLGEFYYMMQNYCRVILTSKHMVLSPYVYEKAYDIISHSLSEEDNYDVPMNYIQILNISAPVMKHGV